MTRFVFVAITFAASLSAVACSNTVEGQNPEPSKTDTAQTQPGSQGTSQGSANGGSNGGTNGGTESKGDGKSQTTCPEIDIPQCAETDELVTGNDENGCSYAYCKPNACPPIATPMCAAGTTLKYTTDENGCTFATCE